jgi:hypothetical protein
MSMNVKGAGNFCRVLEFGLAFLVILCNNSKWKRGPAKSDLDPLTVVC